MAKRKALSNKTRFEVFKRDSFICQYCGNKAPDVVLEVDHIKPVSKGGENEVMNLVTSCFECNSGKSDRLLSDSTVIDKQRKQIEELQTRKEQLEMMLQWKIGLSHVTEDENQKVIDFYNSKWQSYSLTEKGENDFKGFVKKYGAIKVIDAIDASFLKWGNPSNEQESFSFVISRVKALLYYNSMSQDDKAKWDATSEVLRRCRAKFGGYQYDYKKAASEMNNFIKMGGTIDQLNERIDNSNSFYNWIQSLWNV